MRCRLVALAFLSVFGALLSSQTGLSQSPACKVQFELVPRGGFEGKLPGKLILRAPQGEQEPLTVEARAGQPVSASLPCSTDWEVTVDIPGAWAPKVTAAAYRSGANQIHRIALWPLGRITGTANPALKAAKLPESLGVTLLAPRSAKAPPDLPKGRLDCPLDEGGRWECSLPASTFDLMFSMEGYVPQYRWGLQVPADKPADLGVMQWKQGASVAGWVVVEDGTLDASACRARLTPLLSPSGDVGMAERIRSVAAETRVGGNGFFQLSGIAPGHYSLEVSQPGFAPGKVSPVEVKAKGEIFLWEVALKRPLQIEVAISPATDGSENPWRVEVSRQSDTSVDNFDTVFKGATDAQGLATVKDQLPGTYLLRISNGSGDSFAERTVQIMGPADAYQRIEIDALSVTGTVKLGKEPLEATLWFGGRSGATRVEMRSDPEGGFQGILPKDGWWPVEVEAEDPKLRARTNVKVTADRKKRAEVEIALPATRLFGKVVDEQGSPVDAAKVILATEEGGQTEWTAEDGSFEFRGIAEGQVLASAEKGEETSGTSSVFLREGTDVGPIELRLRELRRLSGTVQSLNGPVPGAGVLAFPLSPVLMGTADDVRSDLDGSFAVTVPGTTERAGVIVSPPGHALKAFSLAVSESSQVLMVPQEGGSLEVSLPPKTEDAEKEGVSLWVFQDGLPIPRHVLYQWATGHGQDFLAPGEKGILAPHLAPGQYRACLAAQSVLAQWWASNFTAPLAKCAAGQLTAGGTLRLDLSED